MELATQQRLSILAAAVAAVVLGWQVANEDFLLPALALIGLVPWLGSRLCNVPMDAWLGGGLVAGYLIGNRGFAQLHVPGVPLLPGEAVLAAGALILAWRSARRQTLPLLKDPLNLALLVWLLMGLVRLRYDFPVHRFIAVRDFALIYYAGFFFLAQAWAERPDATRWIKGAFTFGFAVGAPVFLGFTLWPDFFVRTTEFLGAPLVFVKSDVAGGFMVAGALWFVDRHLRTPHPLWLGLAAFNLVALAFSNSRAAFVALACVLVALLWARDWRRLRPLLALGLAGGLLLLADAAVRGERWPESHLNRLVQTGLTMVDWNGTRGATLETLSDKADNNQFRLVWWRTVVDETMQTNPWFGLGFGHDLSRRFTGVYYSLDYDDLTARSPHNVVMTVFGRLGSVGLVVLLALLGSAVWRYRQARRLGAAEAIVPWLGAGAIFVSACFGVVLEGPMGAVVFWTLLGLANGLTVRPADPVASSPAAPAGRRPRSASIASGVG